MFLKLLTLAFIPTFSFTWRSRPVVECMSYNMHISWFQKYSPALWVVMLALPLCPPHLVTVRCSSGDRVRGNAAWRCCASENGWYPCFCDSSVGEESACNAGDPGSIPGSGRSPGEGLGYPLKYSWASLVAQTVRNPPAVRETRVQSLGWEDPLEKGTATHSSILAWRIPRGSQRVGHNWVTFIFTFLFLSPWAALAQAEFSPVNDPLLTRRKTFWLSFPFSWFIFHNLAFLSIDTAGWEKFSWLHFFTQGLQQSPCHPLSMQRWEGAADPLLGDSAAESTWCPTSTVSGWGC